jgi:hypothetical protein
MNKIVIELLIWIHISEHRSSNVLYTMCVPALSAAHITHTRPDQESKSSYVKNHTITQHTLAIIHQTSYGTIIPYIKSNLLGSNEYGNMDTLQ